LRSDDCDPRRDPGGSFRIGRQAEQRPENAPHTAQQVIADKWDRPYSREQAAYPAPWTREHKFWPAVARIDSVYGDRNLFCTCPPMDE
jgi:glycine dehydrogenase